MSSADEYHIIFNDSLVNNFIVSVLFLVLLYDLFQSYSDCGNLTVENGNFNAPSGTTYGETATQSCNIGYTISGEETVTCLESGNWSAVAAVCIIVGKCILILY
jgi:hypothetical protein